MHEGNGKSGSGGPSTQEAAEWYAHNEVGTTLNAESLMKWDAWASDPENRKEYAQIAEIRQQTPRALQAPSDVSRGDLMADLHSEFEGGDS
jgi:ferric-dicitrate binding protein FerR (iron transport regulator)